MVLEYGCCEQGSVLYCYEILLCFEGVTAIIDVSRRENPRFEDLDYLTLHIRDHPEEDITVLFDECFDFIRKTLKEGGESD